MCQSAIQGGVLNVYINTRLMKDRAFAQKIDEQAKKICMEYIPRCEKVYKFVEEHLTAI
jgi:formiminotetrahydrofolate cyclodeaminase